MKFTFANLQHVEAIFFDFDGVFTDNTVYLASDGTEMLKFSKSDSLGLDLIRVFFVKHDLNLQLAVISRERSSIVTLRTEKLNLACFQGVNDKREFIEKKLGIQGGKYIFFGNDVNDLGAMTGAFMSFAPSDAHPSVKDIATHVLIQRGGEGFVRAGLEFLMDNANLKEC